MLRRRRWSARLSGGGHLGMTKVLVHPFSGVFVGLWHGSRRCPRHARTDQGGRTDGQRAGRFGRTARYAAEAARMELREQGIGDAKTTVLKKLHLRYDDADTAMDCRLWRCRRRQVRFEERHQTALRLYHERKGLVLLPSPSRRLERPDVRRTPKRRFPRAARSRTRLPSARSSAMGRPEEAPIYKRDAMVAGQKVMGPAILIRSSAPLSSIRAGRPRSTLRNHRSDPRGGLAAPKPSTPGPIP